MQGKGKRSSPCPPRFRPPLLNVNHVEVSWDQHVENGTGFISDSEVRGTMGMSPIRPPASKMHYSDNCWCGDTSTCRTNEVGLQHEALGTSYITTPIVPLSDQITLPTLQDDIETVQRMAAPAGSRGSSSSDLTCMQVASALGAVQPPQGTIYGHGSVPSFAAAMRERLIHMPRELSSAPTAPPASGTVPGVVTRLDGNGGERLKALEARLQRCKDELKELNEVQRERKGRDPRKHIKLLAIEDTRRQVEKVEARMVTLQGRIDKLTPPLHHTSPSPTVTRALGYREVHGDRTTWIDGAWPAEANTPPALPVQRATSTGSMATHPPTSPSRMVAAVDIDWPGHEGLPHTLPSSDVWSRGLQESDLICTQPVNLRTIAQLCICAVAQWEW